MSEHDQREDYDDEPDLGRLASNEIVAWPASAMWVLGLMQCVITQVFMGFWTVFFVITGVEADKSLREILENVVAQDEGVFALVCWPVATICTLLIMKGANDLRRFRHYPLVVAAAVLTFLSVPCFYLGVLGIPLGMWCFVLLLRRDVRARFEAVSRGATVRSPKFIGVSLRTILATFMCANKLGYVFGSQTGYRCFNARKNIVRKPNVSCVTRGRFLGEVIPKGDISISPDLAVEVVSPNDLYEAVEIKVGEYLAAGVRLVWVVCPATKSMIVRRPNKTANTLHVSDNLSGEDVLPGFSCSIAEIFS